MTSFGTNMSGKYVVCLVVILLMSFVMCDLTDQIVHRISILRQKVFQEKFSNLPKGGLELVARDDELVEKALQEVEKCQFSPKQAYSAGQTSAFTKKKTNPFGLWADERKKYRFSPVPLQGDISTGNFTQMIWHNTINVGCARKRCDDVKVDDASLGNGFLTICRFNNRANKPGEFPYDRSDERK